MKHYSDEVMLATTGLPAVNATVSVFLTGTETLATLYSENDVESDELDNPVTTGIDGTFSFYVADGTYDLRVVATPETVDLPDVEIYDLDELANSKAAAEAAAAAAVAVAEAVAPLLGMVATDPVGRDTMSIRAVRQTFPGVRILRDLYALLAAVYGEFGIMHVGDSLSDTSWETCGTQAQRNIADWMPTAPVWATSGSNILGYTAPTGVNQGASTIYPIGGKYTGTYYLKERYDIAFDGTCMKLAAGQYAVFGYGGQTLFGDYLLIPIVTGPTGGIVRVRYSTASVPTVGGAWVAPLVGQIASGASGHALTAGELLVNTYSATPGLTMVRLNFGVITPLSVRLDHSSGGDVLALKCQTAVKTASSIPTYRMSSPSNDFAQADEACVPIMGDLIAELNYPVIWIASDDTINASEDPPYNPTDAYANFLPILEAAIDASGLAYKPAVILEGNPYLSNGVLRTDEGLGARIDYCLDWCQAHIGWDVLDMQATTGGLDEAVAAGLNGDSNPWIHYNGPLARFCTDRFFKSRAYDAPQGRRAGGDATPSQVLLLSGTNPLTPETAADMAVAPNVFDTGYMTWAHEASGSGGNGADLSGKVGMRLSTTVTVAGKVRSYIVASTAPYGKDQGNIRGDIRRIGFPMRRVTTDANSAFYALMRSGGAYNSGAVGALGASGYGFREINGVVVGTCWGRLVGSGGANGLILSTDVGVALNGGSVSLVTGGAADWADCVLRLRQPGPNSSTAIIEWLVDGVPIGQAWCDIASTYFWGFELLSLNGAAVAYTADVGFPRIMRGGGTA